MCRSRCSSGNIRPSLHGLGRKSDCQSSENSPESLSMRRQIKRIAPLQLGKMLGMLYVCMGLIFLPFFALAGLLGPSAAQQSQATPATGLFTGIMFVFGTLIPIIYGVMGFIGGIVVAALYNLFARWIGGIEVEVE